MYIAIAVKDKYRLCLILATKKDDSPNKFNRYVQQEINTSTK